MNIQRKNSAHHFRMQSEREQTLGEWRVEILSDGNWQKLFFEDILSDSMQALWLSKEEETDKGLE